MTLTNFTQVRALSQEEAARSLPVRVEATVLGADPAVPWHLFLHDGTAGCHVQLLQATNAPKFSPGQRLRVEAVSVPLGYYPSIGRGRVKVLGRRELPSPIRLTADQIFLPEFDSAWVEVPALVVGYESKDFRMTLDVEVYGLPFKAELPLSPQAEARAEALMQRPVRLRGVLGTLYNRQRQMTDRLFFVSSFDSIETTMPPEDAGKATLIQVAQMLTGGYGPQTPIRVKGVITQADRKGFYLRDGSGSALVYAARSGRFPAGTEVEVAGFGDVAPFRPILRATRVVNLGQTNTPEPAQFDFTLPDLAPMHAERVTLAADFLGRREGRLESILQCQAGQQVFEALLPKGYATPPELAAGDRLVLTGICELTTTHALPRIGWVDGFRLHLPGAGGLRIVAHAPWWTPSRLLVALSVMSGLTGLGVLGMWTLRRQVKRQSAILGASLSAEAVAQERDRVARDLHDTLEQQLSGVALQLDGLEDALQANPVVAAKSLSLARRMLRFTRVEARRSVWDLRSKVLEQDGLAAALRDMAETATGPAGPIVEVTVSGEPRRLPKAAEFHLFRIAQEALANAIKHSEAQRVVVALEHTPEATRITVSDDGRGFDPHAKEQSPGPHFGLLGMRERAAKIGAQLTLTTSPGAGCTVAANLPVNEPAALS